MSNPFNYSAVPLDRARPAIRLLRILDSSSPTSLISVLQCFPLASLPQYTALSYTWGTESDTKKLSINGRRVPVRKNLWHYLDVQRRKGREGWYWVDAVCIDQSNTSEKTHQVRLMGKIYSWASKVHVWLGPRTEDSNLAMDSIGSFHGRSNMDNVPSPDPKVRWSRAQLKAVLHLCHLPYWRRMWIVQEIYLASSITVYYGTKSVPWGCFDALGWCVRDLDIEGHPWYTEHHNATSAIQLSDASWAVGGRSHWRSQEGDMYESKAKLLQDLLEKCRNRESTEVRDRVFGLIGLVENITRKEADFSVGADYSLSVEEVFTNVYDYLEAAAKHSIRTEKQLNPDATKKDLLVWSQVYLIDLLKDTLRLFPDDEIVQNAINRTCGKARYRKHRSQWDWQQQDEKNNKTINTEVGSASVHRPRQGAVWNESQSSSRTRPSASPSPATTYNTGMKERAKGKGIFSWLRSVT